MIIRPALSSSQNSHSSLFLMMTVGHVVHDDDLPDNDSYIEDNDIENGIMLIFSIKTFITAFLSSQHEV